MTETTTDDWRGEDIDPQEQAQWEAVGVTNAFDAAHLRHHKINPEGAAHTVTVGEAVLSKAMTPVAARKLLKKVKEKK